MCITILQFDFSKEDVPERDPEQVRKSINDTNALLEAIKVRMVSGGGNKSDKCGWHLL